MGTVMQQTFDTATTAKHSRAADPVSADFLGAVNIEMLAVAGVRYTEVYRSLHGDLQALRAGLDTGVTPTEFVDATVKDFGFMKIGGMFGDDAVKAFNKTQAAICEFAMTSEEWSLAPDGCVYNQREDGLGRLTPVFVQGKDECGFGIYDLPGASIGIDGRPKGQRVPPLPVVGQRDIGDAIEKYEEAFEKVSAFAMR